MKSGYCREWTIFSGAIFQLATLLNLVFVVVLSIYWNRVNFFTETDPRIRIRIKMKRIRGLKASEKAIWLLRVNGLFLAENLDILSCLTSILGEAFKKICFSMAFF